ncbi:glycosyltransferase family A protein [Paenibacillus swuensis]|uniref:glycosyltransferase family A protein n=1 Tax=Paenibacillus swuensis TaxID=1178515 RepID=UPI00083888A9|nr:glycosyltransferase family A protein [Paenibacillus swuensis]
MKPRKPASRAAGRKPAGRASRPLKRSGRSPGRGRSRGRGPGAADRATSGGTRLSAALLAAAHRAGRSHRALLAAAPADTHKRSLARLWVSWYGAAGRRQAPPARYAQLVGAYLRGVFGPADPPPWLLLPTGQTVSAVVTVSGGQGAHPQLLRELRRMSLHEIIIVQDGTPNPGTEAASEPDGILTLYYPDALGQDVGRTLGALKATGDILLFTDGSVPAQADFFIPLLAAAGKGVDIALADMTPLLPFFHLRDRVSVLQEFMNHAMGREDLAANSMATLPHALSRKALEVIGAELLMIPPKAQLTALRANLIVSACRMIHLSQSKWALRSRGTEEMELRIGDHLEAMEAYLAMTDGRFHYQDRMRKRKWKGSS